VPKSYESWLADKESQSSFEWSQLRLARVDGEPAAMFAGTNQFVPDENCGYVATLATLPDYRGRGLGALLLRDAFARDARAGRVGTYLHVDANNTTPALGLYESVGMRQVLAIEIWRRTVSA
jgi:ribosomal protein S18 acetylase RimI-like enzyme